MGIDFVCPIRFGDELTAQRYLERCKQALSTQRVRWAVAPSLTVTTPHEVTLREAEEVTVQAMRDGQRPAALLIRDLIARGFILERADLGNEPPAAA